MNIHSRGRLPVSLIRIAIIPAASNAAAARRLAAHSGITTKYNEPKIIELIGKILLIFPTLSL